jgi:hypothetical protein
MMTDLGAKGKLKRFAESANKKSFDSEGFNLKILQKIAG